MEELNDMNTLLPAGVAALLISFVISAAVGRFLIPFMHRIKAGQTERSEGPQSHLKKTGTPNMGGLMILAGFVVSCLILSVKIRQVLPVVFLTVGFGIVGFIDDYLKVVKRRSDGLSAKQKMLLQIVIAIIFAILVQTLGNVDLSMIVPFTHGTVVLDLGWFSIPTLIFIAVATVNGTNFTDGVDGLASCVTIAVALFFTIAAVITGSGWMAPAGCAMIGALLGFLIYNASPAQIFMGDTGSLALGGFVVGMAYSMQMPLFIPIVGIIYVIEVLSVIIQVLYFKRTHGKRFFKMAPIHHHFELSGWSEVKVVAVFTCVTVIASAIALLRLNP